MDVSSAARELQQALLTTKEFNELKNAKTTVNQNKKSKDVLDQFQKKQEMLYSGNLSQNQLQQLMDEIDQDYAKLSSVPEIKQYFTAVDNFNYLMAKIFKDINAFIDNNLR